VRNWLYENIFDLHVYLFANRARFHLKSFARGLTSFKTEAKENATRKWPNEVT